MKPVSTYKKDLHLINVTESPISQKSSRTQLNLGSDVLNVILNGITLTILAADDVCISFHTVSESIPTPPQGKRQNRVGGESANTTHQLHVVASIVKSLYKIGMELNVSFIRNFFYK